MKKALKIIAVPVILFILYVIIFLCIEFFYILEPSQGEKIDRVKNPGAVILVIDVQNKLTAVDNPEKAAKLQVGPFIDNIKIVLKKLDKTEAVYIRQEFSRNSLLSFILPMFPEEGEAGTEINSLVFRDNSRIFTKSKADAFTNPSLQKYLESKHAGTLYITGLAAEACVERTIMGAVQKGYRVIVIKEAVISMYGGQPGKDVLEKYTSYGAEIISVKDLKQEQVLKYD